MLPILVIKKKMNTIEQPSKGDNVCQNPNNITQLSINNNSKNDIKIIFNVNLHHDPIRVKVEKGLDAKRDDLTASKG